MNTQITEDYCSFEVAKLLKEKGFDEPTCGFYYDNYTEKLIVSSPSNHSGSINTIAAPSQAQVRKWLRVVHNIDIEIFVCHKDFEGNLSYDADIRHYGSLMITERNFIENTYEEVVEAALKYCLTNLI